MADPVDTVAPPAPPALAPGLTYLRFLSAALRRSFSGSWRFYAWMTVLTAIALVGLNGWGHQLQQGMQVTRMSDHVSWGLYIANFTFGVGLAAGAVMMVIPAYLYDDHDMHDVVIIGELLAIAAIAVCIGFIVADMGRPDRMWHILPGIGRFHWPVSMLTWDVLALNGYLLINLHIAGYLMYQRYRGKAPRKRWYLPFVFLSIGWAISIHTVTAFLYQGLGGRPFWNSALLAPRFLATAFISGPAFVIVLLHVVRWSGRLTFGDGPIRTLTSIMRVTVLLNLFMLMSELFTALYTGGAHAAAVKYLFFGSHGKRALVPYIWTAVTLNVTSAVLLFLPRTRVDRRWLLAACACAFVGVYIEKGMGLIIPGFVPSTLHEVVEYTPSITEWKVTAGVWALGLLILTVALKVGLAMWTGKVRAADAPPMGDAAP
ncbi:MAG: polysulfide reductase NrfD [Myxococcales bacterium]|nr:polysulfide reductase NrfD [Myxococcales bacterium]MBK7195417.1 polysulfide reductase NrfD [Myxococcales bacterium]MBP6845595.1 polysulfide reductase NrfD [Kofleriaceae bacterium]